MKAEELRLGNLIKYVDKIIECDINIIYSVSKLIQPSRLYVPIELTEEWMLKLGFEISTYHEVYIKNNIIIDKDFCLAIEDCNEGYLIDIGNELKYVHQVQNLYFALTGEELKINKS